MNTEHILEITLTVRGPILVQSTNPAAFGVDAAVARVAFGAEGNRGKPCIPGTLLKGKIAEALAQLSDAEPPLLRFATDWLGIETDDPAGHNDPYRGRIQFGDLVTNTEEDKNGIRHRIAINDDLGSVEEKMLQVMEMPFPPGKQVVFQGTARFFANEQTAQEVERNVTIALRWLTQCGAERTVGFGRILRVCVRRVRGRTVTPLELTAPPVALDLVIRPLGPLCISKHQIGGNLYESEDFIPGNVLAGAVAETWAALIGERLDPNQGVAAFASKDPPRALLAQHFSKLRFCHAFPVSSSNPRPTAIPHSVVKDAPPKDINGESSVYRDVAAFKDPIVFKNGDFTAPTFRVDWKPDDYEKVDKAFKKASPAKELRVRTAIDSIRRRADDGKTSATAEAEGKLFAWEMVHPCTSDNQPIVWRGRIDLDEVPQADRKEVAEQLSSLLNVLSFVSKTKTACDVTATPVATQDTITINDGTVRLVLQTPALLCDPRFQRENGNPLKTADGNDVSPSGALTKDELHALYAAVWSELSEGALTLSHYFASQSLAGGEYLYRRFQKRAGKPYNPWLLTDTGSVFVFNVTDATKAKAKIDQWLAQGLPLPQWAKERFGDNWKTNPYIPQNGFGEIAEHHPHPFTPFPNATEIEPLTWAPQ